MLNQEKIEYLMMLQKNNSTLKTIRDIKRIIDKHIFDLGNQETDHGMVNILEEINDKLFHLLLAA